MRIILPKYDVDLDESFPYFYLVGPVLGGGDWQARMCRELAKHASDCDIAVRCRWDAKHELARYFVEASHKFERQLFWEQTMLRVALESEKSCVVCWLAEESKENPRRDGLPYGIDTIGEVNYLRGLLEQESSYPVVIGGASGFPRFEQIIRPNFDWSCGNFQIHSTIKETAAAAAKVVLG